VGVLKVLQDGYFPLEDTSTVEHSGCALIKFVVGTIG
jgi:hypothetical protein